MRLVARIIPLDRDKVHEASVLLTEASASLQKATERLRRAGFGAEGDWLRSVDELHATTRTLAISSLQTAANVHALQSAIELHCAADMQSATKP